METPDAKTLNLADILSGQAYPETQVTIYLDPKASYEIGKIRERIAAADNADEISTLEETLETAKSKAEANSLTIHLKGASARDKQLIIQEIEDQFPIERDFVGRVKPNADADRLFAIRRWMLHITKIEHPTQGSTTEITEQDVENIRNFAPAPAVEAVDKAIVDFESGEKSGFEYLVQSHDFLSQP